MAQTIEIKVPATITIVNTSSQKKGFIPYKENFTTFIPAGDTLKLDVSTVGQVLYYLAQATDGLKITQAPVAPTV